jgi:hypothetical protein
MPLPRLAKTWQYNVNTRFPGLGLGGPAGGDTTELMNQQLLFHIKSALVGFAQSPWTVIGSSNGTTAGMDGIDRWTSPSSIVARSNQWSWIVLQQAGINSKYQVCLDCRGSPLGQVVFIFLRVYVSPVLGFGVANGGTDGSPTIGPTALDQYPIIDIDLNIPFVQSYWNLGGTDSALDTEEGPTDAIVNIWQSTDGQVTRIMILRPRVILPAATEECAVRAYAAFERPRNPIAGWTNPSMAMWIQERSLFGGTPMSIGMLNDNAFLRTRTPSGSVAHLFMTTEAYAGQMATERLHSVNSFTNRFQISPIALASETSGFRGRHGQVFDMWHGSRFLRDGDTFPSDGSRQFIHFQHVILPWNGTSPLVR